jgi:pyruvate/2-oxoglutarate dehydrogenase complex dihydrolipoamide dehydrogenase (E3) component
MPFGFDNLLFLGHHRCPSKDAETGRSATLTTLAAEPLTNIEALELDYVPQHLIVLGGGYVGLEMAQAYRRFGSRVTTIEHGPQLAGREDQPARRVSH